MANAPELILRTLDRHLTGPGEIRLLGGAALILAYGRQRSTEDADLLLDDRECQALIDTAGFSEGVEATNRELEPQGLYLTHIWGPEQIPLGPDWRRAVRNVPMAGLARLTVTALGPLDLILSKLARGDDEDLADVEWVISREGLAGSMVREAIARAVVPEVLADAFSVASQRLLARLSTGP